ncbi:Dam family site-specific DNA-(adenine-N6)-methyltransferase [Helcococcus kunzii]|uniref:Site-specific DNA-methyltransferase (adenine-specific) n=1 Tax=Helcococcus kunzii ATCC 51366 TaxID=883114 RepID=H3NQJ2_9FIRM|nr:Dam family site-specific DNA-(adenine-N6)-methyltransferase [Helcococcus kunzii]EHR32322.1 DNA adenine methylase [Helcococcus kunzii ATCC 51366]MCT1796485.1 Dam family site-specific DNA-(adenine-N6)-methyltransferase [Helcococcus kunzii]MCT1989038.1 Dam family site-specific DNA-(adenine-N6)-methyltransferase [Helcococcus kunzii]
MAYHSIDDIIRELDISKSYLYKLIDRENILIPKSDTGRYFWNENAVNIIKGFLHKDNLQYKDNTDLLISKLGLKQSFINNRRYLGNKYSLSDFIRKTVDENCKGVNIVIDIFSGTGAVANTFKDKMLITNDLLYSNYISNYAWFGYEKYSRKKIIEIIYDYNKVKTKENNYMRENFADTFFSADDCSKIGYIREDIETKYKNEEINFKEYAILITSLLYAMDKIANTVGHYDAYRKNVDFEKKLVLNVLLPEETINSNNICYNSDANELINNIKGDLLYLDPPYNSRQYCDAYHLLENVARWEKPEVYGVARKMDRTSLKSDYCMISATNAFEELIENAEAKYILLSYNNMSDKGNERSNAKISDEDIMRILSKKGKVTIFESDYKSFSTGKSNIKDNKERLFLCEVFAEERRKMNISSPFNYIGGKFKLLEQLQPLFAEKEVFLDLFAGGGNVGINSISSKVIFNDSNEKLIDLIKFIKDTDTNLLLKQIDNIIDEYGLSNTSLYGYSYYDCDSSRGLAEYNKERFFKLRNDFNTKILVGETDYSMLYVLIVFSFNNQIRFNRKGLFNTPVGKRDFNSKMRSKLMLFSEELKSKDIHLMKRDFRDISLDEFSRETFIYCDPPYLITNATYNENGMWTEIEEKALLEFLDEADKKGFSFALSNILESKDKKNDILYNWIESKGYYCNRLNKSYSNSSYHRKNKNSISEEVLITNYPVEWRNE